MAASGTADWSTTNGTNDQLLPESLTSDGSRGVGAGGGLGTGSAVTIANGATVEIDGPSAQSVTFAGTTGTLRLEDPQAFTGVISGMTGADAIDFSSLAYGVNIQATYSGDATGGTLTVTDGTQTARVALAGDYLSSSWTVSSDGKGGTSVVDPTLPPGVTLQPIDGGPTYYASNGFTYAANAGWDNPNFIPIGPWLDMLVTQSDATRWRDLDWNTGFALTQNSSLSVAASNGISVVQAAQDGILPGTGAETVGILTFDEASTYADAVSSPIKTTPNSIQNGRFWYVNNTWNYIRYGPPGGPGAPTDQQGFLYTPVATPNGSTRHIDASSVDLYLFAGAKIGIGGWLGALDNLGRDATQDEAARGSNYGDLITDQEAFTGGKTPLYAFIEDGGPYPTDTSAADYITPPELNWATWSSLIHGARGVIYFNHTFGGPAQGDDNLAGSFYQTVQPGQSVSIYTQVKNTDALVEQMAPVLNSPTALNYVAVNTPGYVNRVVTSLFSGIEVLAKDNNGQFYIFADTRDSETQKNIPATFTLADKNATSVTVVNENRTISVANGVFTDTFATGATVHIYKVNSSAGTGSPGDTTAPAAPVISSDTVSGNIVTLNGAAEANSTIAVFDNATKLGMATANGSGAWTYTTGTLASGSQSFTATATDAAGNVSPLSSPLVVTLAAAGGRRQRRVSGDQREFRDEQLQRLDGRRQFRPHKPRAAALCRQNGRKRRLCGGLRLGGVGRNLEPDDRDDGRQDLHAELLAAEPDRGLECQRLQGHMERADAAFRSPTLRSSDTSNTPTP